MYDIGPMLNNIKNNQQFMEVMKLVKESNMSPKELFYKKAEEMGVDPNEILKTLQSLYK